jgi:hypothetical protein
MTKICFGILTCAIHKERFKKFMKIHEKWFNDNDFMYYILQSDPKLIGTGVEYIIKDHYFFCAAEEAYELLAHKLAIFYSFIYEKTDFDFVYKVDDGCLIIKENLLNIPKFDYFGALMQPTSGTHHFGKCKKPKYNRKVHNFEHAFDKFVDIDPEKFAYITKITYTGGGYGYGMSRNALQYIPKYKNHIMNLPMSYEDVLFGQIMFLENIKPTYYVIGDYHKIK